MGGDGLRQQVVVCGPQTRADTDKWKDKGRSPRLFVGPGLAHELLFMRVCGSASKLPARPAVITRSVPFTQTHTTWPFPPPARAHSHLHASSCVRVCARTPARLDGCPSRAATMSKLQSDARTAAAKGERLRTMKLIISFLLHLLESGRPPGKRRIVVVAFLAFARYLGRQA